MNQYSFDFKRTSPKPRILNQDLLETLTAEEK